MNNLPNIFYIQPYSLDFHYGNELNKHIELMPDDAWVVITDYDTLYLTPNFGRTISNAIVTYPDTELFSCEVNRLGQHKKCYDHKISCNTDVMHHMKIAKRLERVYGHQCEIIEGVVAGVFWCFPKSVWLKNKFDSHTIIWEKDSYLTSFDVRWSEKILGLKRRILGLYIWHSYRLNQDINDTNHLEI